MTHAEALPPARKNFVKANVLAAAKSKVKSTVHLEVPKGGGSLGQTGKSLSGSSRSLNSEPGVIVTKSPATSFIKRGSVDPQRRTLHNFSSRPSNVSTSATRGKSSSRSKNPRTKATPSSVASLNVPSSRDRRKSISPRPSLPAGSEFRFDNLPLLNTEENSSNNTSGQLSRRSSSSFNEVDSEILKSLRQKQEHFQLLMENLQTDTGDLRSSLELAEKRNDELDKKYKLEIEEMKFKFEEFKGEMKSYFLGLLEVQRNEMRDEIRKLLSFKDSSSSSLSPSVHDNADGKTKSFKHSKEKLFSKIHRLSARMSMQDLDMKELQEVKTWNEKKLETELSRLQDSVKKPPAAEDTVFRVPDDATARTMWTQKQGQLEHHLATCGSVSEPDISGMFDTDSGVISQKMLKLAPSMSTLEAFPPPSPALANNSLKKSDAVPSLGGV
jgi:hypothetical protein